MTQAQIDSASRVSTFHALSHPVYRRLWAAAWLWYMNRWIEMVVLSWLVLDLTDSPAQVALVGVSRMTPMFLLGLIGGSLADRFPKLKVITATQIVNLAVTIGMMLVILSGGVQPWHVFLASFFMGMSWTIDFSARRSYFAELFGPDRLINAISLDAAAMTGSGIVGPLIGGTLISLVGFGGAYGLMVGLFGLGLVMLLTIRAEGVERPLMATGSVFSQVTEAIRTIRTNRMVWAALSVTVALNFFGFPYIQMVPVIAWDVLGVDALLYSVLSAGAGVGSFVTSLIIASRGVLRQGTLYSLGATLMLFSVVLFAFSPYYVLSLLLLVVAGMGMAGFATMQPAIILQAMPPEMRGRAMGAIALGIGASPLGMLIVGNLAEVVGPRMALGSMAGAGVVVMLALRLWLPELRDKARPTAAAQVIVPAIEKINSA